jgi:hypothetical protein
LDHLVQVHLMIFVIFFPQNQNTLGLGRTLNQVYLSTHTGILSIGPRFMLVISFDSNKKIEQTQFRNCQFIYLNRQLNLEIVNSHIWIVMYSIYHLTGMSFLHYHYYYLNS